MLFRTMEGNTKELIKKELNEVALLETVVVVEAAVFHNKPFRIMYKSLNYRHL